MKPEYFASFKSAYSLLRILFSSPALTLRLTSWSRIQNAMKAIFLRQGNWKLLLQRYEVIYNSSRVELSESFPKINSGLVDIVLFPVIDWGFRFQRPQHIARELGSRGHRVFYISTVPLMVSSAPGYLVRDSSVPGVVLVQLSSGSVRMPNLYKDQMSADETRNFSNSLSSLCAEFSIESPTILIQHPFWWPLVTRLNFGRTLYDCFDHHSGFLDRQNDYLQECEVQLVNYVDEVVVSSAVLRDSFIGIRECHVVRNGCEYSRFSKATRIKSDARPVIGYVGAISEWFDGQLLFEIARERQDWQFNLYGAIVGADVSRARSLPNVNFFGEIPYQSVPSVIGNFDVCIIPFKLNSLTFATNPVKVYEYLAVGRPVVSTKLPELADMEDFDVLCGDSVSSFATKIEYMLEISDRSDRVRVRKDWAARNDWAGRVDQLIPFVRESIDSNVKR